MERQKFENIVTMLNHLLEIDRSTISKMYITRYRIDRPTESSNHILVRDDGTISSLGALNGVMDIISDETYRIAVAFDPEVNLVDKFVLVETKSVSL